jgi:hypothetical protein
MGIQIWVSSRETRAGVVDAEAQRLVAGDGSD